MIAGAGPSGLAVAIFLHELGYTPRIIDKKKEISTYSKALGVNPRTLTILDEFKITPRFLQNGRKMPAVNMWKNDKLVLKNDFSKSPHKYPFILVQTQRESEQILLEELSDRKIKVEYGTELGTFSKNENGFNATLIGGDKEQYHCDLLIGADGGHSVVRKRSGIEYHGFRYKDTWELYDLELEMDLPADDANIRLVDKGGMIMIRIKENTWRVAGNLPDLLNYLPPNSKTGKVSWSAKFNISHSVAKSLVKDNMVLIGDSAHLHSPIGGRGMNLGIEDAYLVSKLIHENRLYEYEKMRIGYLRKTVSRVNNITQIVAGSTPFARLVRSVMGLSKPFQPIVMPALRNFAMGLDTY